MIQTKTTWNRNPIQWTSDTKRVHVFEVFDKDGILYQSLTGRATAPGTSGDWVTVDSGGGAGDEITSHSIVYAGIDEVTLPENAREILDFQVDNGCGYDAYITSFTSGSNVVQFDGSAMGLSVGNRLKFIYIKQ